MKEAIKKLQEIQLEVLEIIDNIPGLTLDKNELAIKRLFDDEDGFIGPCTQLFITVEGKRDALPEEPGKFIENFLDKIGLLSISLDDEIKEDKHPGLTETYAEVLSMKNRPIHIDFELHHVKIKKHG